MIATMIGREHEVLVGPGGPGSGESTR
jgi:hypothetical protein